MRASRLQTKVRRAFRRRRGEIGPDTRGGPCDVVLAKKLPLAEAMEHTRARHATFIRSLRVAACERDLSSLFSFPSPSPRTWCLATCRYDIGPFPFPLPLRSDHYFSASRRGWLIYVPANLRRPLIIVRMPAYYYSASLRSRSTFLSLFVSLSNSSSFSLLLLSPSHIHSDPAQSRGWEYSLTVKTKYTRLSLHHR